MKELWGLRGHQFLHREPLEPAPLLVEKPLPEWPVPQFINLFLPEFPIRPLSRHQQLKILGLVAKGSFGTVLKVLDCGQKAVFAVKVGTKILPHSLVPVSSLDSREVGRNKQYNNTVPL